MPRIPKTLTRPQPKSVGLLRKLGLVGLDRIEPIILAAIATETPLLLIGPHGTAKSLLLCRLCEALRLSWRHYNASLVNYDDLVGYPLPDAHGKLSFVQTPASVWGAQAIFVDELSRARPDMLNRLFPIIHEKKVQGMELPHLLYRWAAMNPPTRDDETNAGENYLGSEPLDPALADRFGFVLEIPSWEQLSAADQNAVITSEFAPVPSEVANELAATIADVRAEMLTAGEAVGRVMAQYTSAISYPVAKLGAKLSSRRAAMLYRNLLAVYSVAMIRNPTVDLADSAWIALSHSLPHRAHGVQIDMARLLIAHNAVWKTIQLSETDPRRQIAIERDPVRRVLRASRFMELPMQDLSSYVADALASLPAGGRHALAAFLIENGVADRLIAAVAEQIADLYRTIAIAQDVNQSVDAKSNKHEAWENIVKTLAAIAPTNPDLHYIQNLLAGLFAADEIKTPDDIPIAHQSWRVVRALCGAPASKEAA